MQQCIKIYFIFLWSSTCFRRHTAHHQEPKTALKASGFAYMEGCWTCSCWTLSASAVLGSWWWAVCHPKHVELHINLKQNLDTLLHLVGFFNVNYTMMHGSTNIKSAEKNTERYVCTMKFGYKTKRHSTGKPLTRGTSVGYACTCKCKLTSGHCMWALWWKK